MSDRCRFRQVCCSKCHFLYDCIHPKHYESLNLYLPTRLIYSEDFEPFSSCGTLEKVIVCDRALLKTNFFALLPREAAESEDRTAIETASW